MDSIPASYLVFEIGVIAIGLVLIGAAFRESRFFGFTTVGAAVYGYLVEHISTYEHAYYYNEFTLMIGSFRRGTRSSSPPRWGCPSTWFSIQSPRRASWSPRLAIRVTRVTTCLVTR